MIEVIEVKSSNQLRTFIDLPNRLYKNDPNYVPGLYVSLKTTFDIQKNPFFKHSKASFFLAFKENIAVGRIAAICNYNHISISGEKCGFFGFFESTDDYNVTKALIDKAVEWCCNQGMTSIVGPENYSTNDSVGFLVDGFDNPPVFMMPYNKPYYIDFFERYGFRKKLDLVSFLITSNQTPDKIAPIIQRIEERLNNKSIFIRPLNMREFSGEMAKLRITYNNAYRHNWGYIPLTEEEFKCQSEELKKIADPKMILFAEKDGIIIAFICAFPDINQVLIRIRNGRLFPFGLFKLFYYRKTITRMRILILGVLDEYRGQGIDAILYERLFERGRDVNINTAEASYVMENNDQMIRILRDLGAREKKRYRLYEYDIST